MANVHSYCVTIEWTGNTGDGTRSPIVYSRDHEILCHGKPMILGSSDPAFRGNPARYNPEELLLASLSACHMLWFLSLCADEGISVSRYIDKPIGFMIEEENGSGRFQRVLLRPHATLESGRYIEKANTLHKRANDMCFIAASVNFLVEHDSSFSIGSM